MGIPVLKYDKIVDGKKVLQKVKVAENEITYAVYEKLVKANLELMGIQQAVTKLIDKEDITDEDNIKLLQASLDVDNLLFSTLGFVYGVDADELKEGLPSGATEHLSGIFMGVLEGLNQGISEVDDSTPSKFDRYN